MIITCIILSTLSLIMSMASIIWLLAKHLSSHKIEYINPMANMQDMFDQVGIGKPQGHEFRDFDDVKGIPVDPAEMPKKR